MGNAADRSILHSSSRATRNVGRKFHGPSSAHTLVWCSSAWSVHLHHAYCLHGGRSDKSYYRPRSSSEIEVLVIHGYRYFPPEAGASTVKQRVWTKLPASSNKTLEAISTFWIEPFL